MVAMMMMSAKLATVGLLKIKAMTLIPVHDVASKILSRDTIYLLTSLSSFFPSTTRIGQTFWTNLPLKIDRNTGE